MKLIFFNRTPNFGDQLNLTIWENFFPDEFFDNDEAELFLGIGSILWEGRPASAKKYIAGSGYGGYGNPIKLDDSWSVLWVRGPRTAKILGLEQSKAICDPAVLINRIRAPLERTDKIVFIPHFKSVDRGSWEKVCQKVGLKFIDPRDPVEKILHEIETCKFVITEAMHGAIVADALRTPWIAIEPIETRHRMKWFDWSESLQIDLRFHKIFPSSILEYYVHKTRYRGEGQFSRGILQNWFTNKMNHFFVDKASKYISSIILKATPQLSDDEILQQKIDQCLLEIGYFISNREK